MLTTTLSSFRKDVKKYINQISQDFETLIINRGKDKGVVLMSLEEYNSLMATHHEMSSKKNKQRLDSAVQKLRNDISFQKDLIEP